MDFVAENERILNEWRNHLNQYEYFAPDGIMYKGEIRGAYKYYDNDDYTFRWIRIPSGRENILWTNAPLRVLFLTKDQNSSGDTAWDVRSETYWAANDNITPKDRSLDTSTFNKNLVHILYGILNTKSDQLMGYSDFADKKAALSFVDDSNCIFARINCKKEVGGEKCENYDLKKAIERDGGLLKEQILNLDADILVCCGHQRDENLILNTVYDIYEDEFEYVPCGKGTGMHYNAKQNKLAIDAYHLSYIKGGLNARYNEIVGMYYEFLKYLKNSEKYKNIDFSVPHR